MKNSSELADESARVRKARQVVDIATSFIIQSRMPRSEAETPVAGVRRLVLTFFPDGEQTFEIIYTPRFTRLIDELCEPDTASPAVANSFPSGHGCGQAAAVEADNASPDGDSHDENLRRARGV